MPSYFGTGPAAIIFCCVVSEWACTLVHRKKEVFFFVFLPLG